MSEELFLEKWASIVHRAWTDEAFKERLISDPRTVLAENEITVGDDVTVRIIEDPAQIDKESGNLYLRLPPRPADTSLTDEELQKVAGGLSGFDFKSFLGETGQLAFGSQTTLKIAGNVAASSWRLVE